MRIIQMLLHLRVVERIGLLLGMLLAIGLIGVVIFVAFAIFDVFFAPEE